MRLEADQTIEYFELDKIIKPCNKTIQNLKACDYVLADHSRKRLLFCELKNSQNRGVIKGAKTQLDHSKHIVNLFLNIFEKNKYSYALLVLHTKKMNKRTTKTRPISSIKSASIAISKRKPGGVTNQASSCFSTDIPSR